MDIEVQKKGQVCVLTFSGKMTLGQGPVLLARTFERLSGQGERLFVLNVVDVPYMDSAGVAEIVACHKRCREDRGRIRLVVDPRGKLYDILRLLSLDRVFRLFDDEEEAIASFIGEPLPRSARTETRSRSREHGAGASRPGSDGVTGVG